ncbi:MAG: DNA gyrase inhibitor YacG [Pseudomonadota bacterium]
MADEPDAAPQTQSDIKVAGAACPQCGKTALHAYRPFCSKRCSDLDLGAWLNGSYAIAGAETVPSETPEGDQDRNGNGS